MWSRKQSMNRIDHKALRGFVKPDLRRPVHNPPPSNPPAAAPYERTLEACKTFREGRQARLSGRVRCGRPMPRVRWEFAEGPAPLQESPVPGLGAVFRFRSGNHLQPVGPRGRAGRMVCRCAPNEGVGTPHRCGEPAPARRCPGFVGPPSPTRTCRHLPLGQRPDGGPAPTALLTRQQKGRITTRSAPLGRRAPV